MLLLIFLGLFGTVSLASWQLTRPRANPVRERLGAASPVPSVRERQLEASFGQRVVAPLVQRSGHRLAAILPANLVRKVESLLLMADEPWSLPGFLSVWSVSAVSGPLLFAWTAFNSSIAPTQLIGIGLLMVPFPALVPYAILRRRARSRRDAITRGLPDALDLLTTSVEAGMAIDAAFAMVVEKMRGPTSETFALYLKQAGLGRARRDALDHIAHRSGVPDLLVLAAAINQGEALGTTMGDVLRRQAADLRVLRRQRAQIRAQRAPVLMTIPMTLCFLPAMGAVIVVPSILNLLDFVGGLGN